MTDYEQRVKAIETLGEIRAKYNLWNEKERHYYEALSEAIRVLNAENDKRHYAKIVRCKDCKYKPIWREGAKEEFRDGFDLIFPNWRDNPCPCQCEDGYYAYMPDDNWFCANGERKEQNDADN